MARRRRRRRRQRRAGAGAWPAARGLCGGGGSPASFATQMSVLCGRQLRLLVRHPLALWLHLGVTLLVSLSCGGVFWQLSYDLDSGVLGRIGLVFFLGLYFMLTSLAPLPIWAQERLLYFEEVGAACYGAPAYVLSRGVVEGLLQRLLPSLLCAAIVYPMAGLSYAAPSSPYHAASFAASLGLTNLLGGAITACFGAVCASPAVATLLSVLVVLITLLFCGLVVNLPSLDARIPPFLAAAAAASNSSPKLEAVRDPQQLIRRNTEVRANSKDVRLQSVRISGTLRRRDQGGHGSEFVTYLVDSVLLVHGVQTTLRSERRYKHFNLLDQLLRKEFGPLVPQALPAKRAFGNLQPAFVEERRVALERYLQQCICIPALATCSLFCNFVEVSVLQSERS